jgi:hypothetical protein
MSASPQLSAMDRHYQRHPELRERLRRRQALIAQQDELSAQATRLYEDVRVVERGIAEIEKKLEELGV